MKEVGMGLLAKYSNTKTNMKMNIHIKNIFLDRNLTKRKHKNENNNKMLQFVNYIHKKV